MIVCLRLLAGLTSLSSKRCVSHFVSIGPSGILASRGVSLISSGRRRATSTAGGARGVSTAIYCSPSLFDDAEQHRDGNRDVADGDCCRRERCKSAQPARIPRIIET